MPYASKKYSVWNWMDRQQKPFTLDDLTRRVDVSEGYARQCIHNNPTRVMFAARPKGSNFYTLYFPHGWTREQVQAYLDRSTDSGKSKAVIHETRPQ